MTTTLLFTVLAKVTVVMALALAGTRLAQRSRAAVRHVLLAGAFAVLLILPMASVVAPSVRVSVPAAVQQAIVPADTEMVVDPDAAPDSITGGSAATSSRSPWASPSLSTVLLAAWIAGAVFFVLPVPAGLWQVRVLRRSALPWRDGRAMLDTLAADAGIHRRIDVLVHESLPGPMTCGVLHPAIVLPIDAPSWTTDDLRRALVHELEHVRRGDWLSHCVARAVAACYWFHPIVWAAWRQLSLEAERACDDAVLRASEATDYADQLVLLAQRLTASSGHPQLAMANRSDLSARVMAVLDARQPRGRAGAAWVAAATAVTVALALGVSSIRLVSAAPADQAAQGAVKPKYDAASIKPCVAEENPTGARGGAGGTNATFSPGRFYVPCVTTEQLIYLAYASYGARDDERLVNDDFGTASNATKIRGGPAWVHSLREKYSIEATAAGATERTVLMGAMLQSLLEDRFHLKIHRGTEEVPLYSLTVGKGGLKLKPMKDGDCDPDAEPGLPVAGAKPKCGNLMMGGSPTTYRWTFNGFALSSLASQLSRTLGVHVVDKTGITDKFMFQFEFSRDEAGGGDAASAFTAVEEQLGLKLEKTKGPRGFLVIDAIERPIPDGPTVYIPAPARAQGAGGRR